MIFAHEANTGAHFYDLESFDQVKGECVDAKTHSMTLPVGFTQGGPFAIIGNTGMYAFGSKFMR
jgi:hypothetical protein